MPFAIPAALTGLWALATRWQFLSGFLSGNLFGIFKPKPQGFWSSISVIDILALAALLFGAATFLKQVKKLL